jgi:hypothetical protein
MMWCFHLPTYISNTKSMSPQEPTEVYRTQRTRLPSAGLRNLSNTYLMHFTPEVARTTRYYIIMSFTFHNKSVFHILLALLSDLCVRLFHVNDYSYSEYRLLDSFLLSLLVLFPRDGVRRLLTVRYVMSTFIISPISFTARFSCTANLVSKSLSSTKLSRLSLLG